jgi:hypothetical protein
MFSPEFNNFSLKSIYEIDKIDRNLKKNHNIVIDLSGTKYDLLRTVTNNLDWYQLE